MTLPHCLPVRVPGTGRGSGSSCSAQFVRAVQAVAAAGASHNVLDKRGWTPLIKAVVADDAPAVQVCRRRRWRACDALGWLMGGGFTQWEQPTRGVHLFHLCLARGRNVPLGGARSPRHCPKSWSCGTKLDIKPHT